MSKKLYTGKVMRLSPSKRRHFKIVRSMGNARTMKAFGTLVDPTGRRASSELRVHPKPPVDDIRAIASEWKSVSDSFSDAIRKESETLVRR